MDELKQIEAIESKLEVERCNKVKTNIETLLSMDTISNPGKSNKILHEIIGMSTLNWTKIIRAVV